MAAQTTEPITPLREWDQGPISGYTTRAAVAGGVAWDLLTHTQGFGRDLTLAAKLRLPEGVQAEDMHELLWDVITEAAEIGYTVAQIKTEGFDRPFDGAMLTTSELARAVAALRRHELVEDGQAFEDRSTEG